MIVKKILTASTCWPPDRLFSPVKSRPDGAGGVISVDASLVDDGSNEVKSVVPGWVDHPLVPGAAVVLDFDPGVVLLADDEADSEGAAGEAGAAVLGSVGSEFGGAQDHVVCPRAVFEDCAQVGTDSAGLLGASGIGDLGSA
jgi:hypothetical protein